VGPANDFVKRFSGGMKRRLEVARAFLHRPKILFLDEPTIGLDPQTRNHIWSYIQQMSREESVTVFFTTHYMEEADRVAGTLVYGDRYVHWLRFAGHAENAVTSAVMQGLPLVMNFLVMQLFFFSNALFPIQGLPKALQVVVRFNPSPMASTD
jgi:energy-coupling factor transporter ATP-binding protein EcfA2